MRNLLISFVILASFFCSCCTAQVPLDEDEIRFDFGMIEKGIEWLDFINSGADDEAIKSFFMAEVAPTGGCQSIIHHWERFMKWDNEEFFSFIMEALGRIPSDKPTHQEDGTLTMFGQRRKLWKEALGDTGQARSNLEALKKADFALSLNHAKNFLPAEAKLKADFYIVLFGHSNAFSVGEENGFDLLQLPRKVDGGVDIEAVIRLFAHELHHTGFSSIRDTFISEIKEPERILLLGILAAEGMPTHFIDEPSLLQELEDPDLESIRRMEVDDWKKHSALLTDLYRTAEADIKRNLEGSLSQKEILEYWMSGAKGAAYVLGANMFSVIEEYLGLEKAVSVAADYRDFLTIYNSAARLGIEKGVDLFLFEEGLAQKLSAYK
ncbi:DUF5700 domain-containing putative Zn-dependent protease [Acidobacteriota bacterium]